MPLSHQHENDHDRSFAQAMALIKDYLRLSERPNLVAPGRTRVRNLRRAAGLLEHVLQLNPDNWSAMWHLGKIHQRLEEHEVALWWFGRACQVNPTQPDVAREASISAMEIGRLDDAILYAERACQHSPADAGIQANLALAYLLASRLSEAQGCIRRALDIDPTDQLSQTLAAMIRHFDGKGAKPPASAAALLEYWSHNAHG